MADTENFLECVAFHIFRGRNLSKGYFIKVLTIKAVFCILDTKSFSIHHSCTMEKEVLSRNYLETLTSADLIALADDYGIDIPEGLNRRFIIGELLEAIDEANEDETLDLLNNDSDFKANSVLPKSYNETQITLLFRNPAWAFVYWDLNESDYREVTQTKAFSTFVLRVLYFSQLDDEKPAEVYDIPVKYEDLDRYILLSQAESAVRIDFVAEFKNQEPRVLAKSRKVAIPKGCPEITFQLKTEK